MNQPFFWAFLLTYFLSFDALVHNTLAGSIAFIGSLTGVSIVAMSTVKPENKK
jgi:hypothetical protein